jgi:hypothetical protein
MAEGRTLEMYGAGARAAASALFARVTVVAIV